MKVLVVGGGGREHSVVQQIAKSKQVETVYVAPGNSGMENIATCVPIDVLDIDRLVQFAKDKAIDLTVVGPEGPLNAGIADAFEAADLKVFAPKKAAALLEGSKAFAKDFMMKYDIPTAAYATFTDPVDARVYIENQGAPIVIKADGLAEGKGVVVAMTLDEALAAIDDMMVNKAFADAGNTIVVEEFLEGREYSLIAFVHENNVFAMIPARDHKRAYDHDEGPNTGGMGVFAPVADITDDIIAHATEEVLQKAADGLMTEGRPFTGILYAGLMETAKGTKVIEFNTRFGDPETQVVLPLLENDLVQVFLDVLDGKDPQLAWKDATCVGVVVASKGYPLAYDKGLPLPTLEVKNEDAFIVHAGTKLSENGFVSNGGRVLLYGAIADDMNAARKVVYDELAVFDGNDNFFYRTDIGK